MLQFLRRLLLTTTAVLAIAAMVFAYLIVREPIRDAEEYSIWSGLKSLSEAPSAKHPFGAAELVCFGYGVTPQEFIEVGQRIGRDLFRRGACGEDNSCCYLQSDQPGVIAIVKDDTIRCKQIQYFSFAPVGERAFCTRPEMLAVRRRVFEKNTPPPHPAFASPGLPYFEIGEKIP